MKVDLYSWILILKWGVSDTSIVQEREGFEKKNDYLSFEYDFPRKDYFCSGNSQLWPYSRFFLPQRWVENVPTPFFWMKLSQIKNTNPSS